MPFDATNFTTEIASPVVENETQRILREAREIIAARHGWASGHFSIKWNDGTRSYCSLGALQKVGGGFWRSLFSKRIARAHSVLREAALRMGWGGGVIECNDKGGKREALGNTNGERTCHLTA